MKDITMRWVQHAQADLDAAWTQLKHGKRNSGAYEIAVFHCHQAIEKMLKAHLIEQGKEVIKIHDLRGLRAVAGLHLPTAILACIDALQPFYLFPRYPDVPAALAHTLTPNRQTAQRIYIQTHNALIWLKQHLTQKK